MRQERSETVATGAVHAFRFFVGMKGLVTGKSMGTDVASRPRLRFPAEITRWQLTRGIITGRQRRGRQR